MNFPFTKWFVQDEDPDAKTYDPSYGLTEWSYEDGFPSLHDKGNYGYASFYLNQEALEVRINYYSLSLGEVVATIGSRFIGLFGIFYFLISSYESFSFEKSAIKAFYFSSDEKRGNEGSNNLASRLRQEMYLQKDFSMGYCNYIAVYLVSSICCCLTSYIDRDRSWYRSGIMRLNRLRAAKAKLEHELDLA